MTRTCETDGQELSCDCEIYHRGCPAAPSKPTTHTLPAGASAGKTDEEALSTGEMFVVALAIIIIICGCGYFAWIFIRKDSLRAEDDGPATADELDDDTSGAARKLGRKKKQGKQYGAAELDNAEDDL